ncbi:hypothetical protein PoB_002926700 [Plakobranchus ocellatus]|uniref:Uncharacterized protein n=1 Tax=Plakobranchus ocellatus TaxID=259542 RepID=A0AAV4A777_9GAST|nr:hypothetical protein PoB_002926700 [Plakobranchus ocellatus]
MKTIAITALFVLIAIVVNVDADEPLWNGLRVKWGRDATTHFLAQPRTITEAEDAGYERIGPSTCGGTTAYNGLAYATDNDPSLTLLYDVRGKIAGIQAGVLRSLFDTTGYPSQNIRPPFVLDGQENNRYVITAYFTDPSKICTEGRTDEQFDEEGTGDNLWIQIGEDPSTLMAIPKQQADIQPPWEMGGCVPTMGRHYWYNQTVDMDCDNFFPVFLMYNEGMLTGFGWAFVTEIQSNFLEYPGFGFLGAFMATVPSCLQTRGILSSMHIYMTDDPWNNYC